ncbi:unnamed protein product, partial [Rotaria sp. Silwood1]
MEFLLVTIFLFTAALIYVATRRTNHSLRVQAFKAVTGHESASIDLSWTFVAGATGYQIQRSPAYSIISKFTTVATISNGWRTSYVDNSNLINGQTYYYKIAARDIRSTSRYSPIIQANPQLAPPDNFKAVTGRESASIELSWASVVGATGYEIQRSSINNDAAIFTIIATISNTWTTNYIDKSNLINAQTYYYKIVPKDSQSTGRFSPIVQAQPQLDPPANFKTVTGCESASIDLLWTRVAGATGYEIQRSSANNDAAKFTIIATIMKASTTDYMDKSNLINGQTYYYRIAANDGRSTGRFSSIIQGNPQLAPPDNFKAVTGGNSASIDLSWTRVAGATGYEIQRSPDPYFKSKFTTVATILFGWTTRYIDKSNLTNGQIYYYKIVAKDSQSTGRFSPIVQGNPQLAPPDNFKALTGHESASIDLSWRSVFGATGYEIQRSSTNNDLAEFTIIATISNTLTINYIDKSNLINGQTYYYKIVAKDSQSTGRFSAIIQANAQLAPPDNFTAVTAHESASIDLSWTCVVGATGYEIQRSSTNNDEAKLTRIATISNTSTSNYIDKSDLINGQTYYYKIVASDSRSTGRFSPIIEASPQLAPPDNFKAVTGGESACIDLSWTSVVGATGYQIQRSSTKSDGPIFTIIAIISNTLTTNYIDKSNLINGETYYYNIAATDSRHTGRFSSIIQAKPLLAAPDNFTAVTAHESASIDLSWTCVVGATGYEIQRSSTNNDEAK